MRQAGKPGTKLRNWLQLVPTNTVPGFADDEPPKNVLTSNHTFCSILGLPTGVSMPVTSA